MDTKEIANRASSLQTRKDLLVLINDLVKDEHEGEVFAFSMKQLGYYSNPNHVRGRYTHFSIPKKSGGVRCISAPARGLRHILYYINIILKAMYKPSDYAMGFCEGRNVVDNAVRHINQNYVFNTDLENFFPSIRQARVWKRLQLKPFNFPVSIANVIAGLCCIRVSKEDGTFDYVLPQGAPTSPLLTNAICDKLDRRLAGLASRFGLHYSRYADDITFSSMHNVYQSDGEFITELRRIISDQHFVINENKTRLQKRGARQEVTGLTVSSKVNVTKKYVAEIRNILHIWERYGYSDAFKHFYPRYKEDKGYLKKGEPVLENVMNGKLLYLKMVKGEKDPVYVALQNRYNRLTCPINADNNRHFDFLRSFTVAEFEEIAGQKINYHLSKNGNIHGETIVGNRNVFISITDAAKVQLAKTGILKDDVLIRATKNIALGDSKGSNPELYVVLTSKNGHAPFWLMTSSDPTVTALDQCLVSAGELIDIWEKDGIDAALSHYKDGGVSNVFSHNKAMTGNHKEPVNDVMSFLENFVGIDKEGFETDGEI